MVDLAVRVPTGALVALGRPAFGRTIAQSDLTYVGGFRTPQSDYLDATHTRGFQYLYAQGFTLKYEPADANALHFLTLGFNVNGNPGTTLDTNDAVRPLVQLRVPTLSSGVPGTPLTWSNWPLLDSATVVGYPPDSLGTGYGAKRLFNYDNIPPMEPIHFDLTGRFGVKYVPSSGRLYQSYNFGYTNYCDSFHMVYCTTPYGNPSSIVATGPWGLSGIGYKALSTWFSWVPQAFADAYTGGKRFVMGGGRYVSQAGACDVSMGPSAIAIAEPSASEQTYLTGFTPLVGYYPTTEDPGVGHGRCARPAGFIVPGRPDVNFDDTWGTGYYNNYDLTSGACVIDTGTVSGLLVLTRFTFGQCSYNSSGTYCEYIRDYALVYSLSDLADVAQGIKQMYEIQPTTIFELQMPHINYAAWPFVSAPAAPVATITATAGTPMSASGTGAIVTTSAPHGYTTNMPYSVRGTNHDEEYGAVWFGNILNATQIQIWNTSLGINWAGTSAAGGTLRAATGARPNESEVAGVDFDETTKRLWVAYSSAQETGPGTGAFGNAPCLFVHCYQLP